MAYSPITSWQIDGETMETITDFIFLGSKITADGDCSHEIKRCLLLGRKDMTVLDSVLKSRDITLLTKVHIVEAMVFLVVMYRCESWTIKNWCFLIVVLEKTLKIPLDSKIKPVNPKGNQPWIFIGRADAEAPTLWPPDGKIWLIRKDRDAGKDWRQEVKGMTEDEVTGWHHWHHGHEFEQTPGDTEGQGSLWLCCRPWGHKELDTTEWLNWTGDTILKSRDITLPTKVHLVKAMVFPLVMYGCKSWTIQKAEHWRFDAFKLWWGRRLLRVPWTAKRSNQSILKEISPEYYLEGLMLKLKVQYFDQLM